MEKKRKVGVAVLTSDKEDFQTKDIVRDKEGHYIMIKETIQQEEYNHNKPLCTQDRNTQICKANLDGCRD